MLLNHAGLLSGLLAAAQPVLSASAGAGAGGWTTTTWPSVITPKVFIFTMFSWEEGAWQGIPEFDLYVHNITVPGLSPLYPDVHCREDYEVCLVTLGEGEINAASTVSALTLSDKFDLRKTYFLIGGIAGINPEVATLASVTFARYAVQVALQYEFDSRELPDNFTTGYIPQGSNAPDEYPGDIYGTEVFEVSRELRDIAVSLASSAVLNDTATAQAYRALYASVPEYAAGAAPPSVVACDVATSDVYFSGNILSQAFANTTRIWTNGTGVYCTTAQEDNASLEALVRSTAQGRTDFSRIIILRTASDFDRPPPSISPLQNLRYVDQGAFPPAVENIYRAGVLVVQGILDGWDSTFAAGVKPTNYIGDIYNTLGGNPDYGRPSFFINDPDTAAAAAAAASAKTRRTLPRRLAARRGVNVRMQ